MDYYEELGIASNASEEEIRRAHRRMTKLLHPDQHTDEAVKQLAEVQMRRLNSIVGVLLDPESRREYDEQMLTAGIPSYQAVRSSAAATRKRISWPWWIASTVAAIILTILVVLLWANNLGSSFGNHTPTYIPPDSKEVPASAAEVTPPPARAEPNSPKAPDNSIARAPESSRTSAENQTPPVTQVPVASTTVAKVPAPADEGTPQQNPAVDLQQNRSEHRALVLPKGALVAQARPPVEQVDLPPPPGISIASSPRLETAGLPLASLPPAPAAGSFQPIKPHTLEALEGEWVYAPTEPEKKKAGFYPPEYIDLKLFRDEGRLHGQYRARYHVTDKPISPDVEFALSPDNGKDKFTWKGPDGTRGTFKISSIDPNVIRIEWRTTVSGHRPALTAGTATLVKRTQ